MCRILRRSVLLLILFSAMWCFTWWSWTSLVKFVSCVFVVSKRTVGYNVLYTWVFSCYCSFMLIPLPLPFLGTSFWTYRYYIFCYLLNLNYRFNDEFQKVFTWISKPEYYSKNSEKVKFTFGSIVDLAKLEWRDCQNYSDKCKSAKFTANTNRHEVCFWFNGGKSHIWKQKLRSLVPK